MIEEYIDLEGLAYFYEYELIDGKIENFDILDVFYDGFSMWDLRDGSYEKYRAETALISYDCVEATVKELYNETITKAR